MKNTVKRIVSLLCITILCALTFAGCKVEDFALYFGIDTMPKNIDPQLAASYSEQLTVRNCFRGLIRLSDMSDNVEYDLIEKCDISEDGLKYRITLKDCEWSNGEKVTAHDFVFAIKRACDPQTKTPFPNLLTDIVGAQELLNGNNATLGVVAEDDKTLVISLCNANDNFLSLLINPVFMPCNQKFFENCKGKYGLDKKHILTNGNYKVSSWESNRHVKLTKTVESDSDLSCAKNVYLTVSSTGKNNITRINDDEIGMTIDSVNDFGTVNTDDFTIKTQYKKNYALVFNKKSEIGSNQALTAAFAKSIHKELYSSKMNNRFKLATSILADDSFLFSDTIKSINLPAYSYNYDAEQSRTEFLEAIKTLKNKKLPNLTVFCIDNDEIVSVLTDTLSAWQRNLGAYVNLERISSESALLNKVSSGDFTIALVPFSDELTDNLGNFATNGNSYLSIQSSDYDKAFERLKNAYTFANATPEITTMVQLLSTDSTVIPIVSVPTAFVWNKNYQNVYFSNRNGTIDFSIIYK